MITLEILHRLQILLTSKRWLETCVAQAHVASVPSQTWERTPSPTIMWSSKKTHDFGCSPILSQFWPHLGYRSRLLIVKWTHLFHNNAHIIKIIYTYIYAQTLYFWTLPPRTMPVDWQWIVKNNIGPHLVRSSSRSGQPNHLKSSKII